jgi:hypothetical protein
MQITAPLKGCIGVTSVQCILSVIGLIISAISCLNVSKFLNYPEFRHQFFRLEVAQPVFKNITGASIKFTLIHASCVSHVENFTLLSASAGQQTFMAFIALPAVLSFDGFTLSEGISSLGESASISLAASNGQQGEGWQLLDWSNYRITADGVRFPNPIPSAPPPNAIILTLDSRPPWPLLVETAIPGLLLGPLLLALAALGGCGRGDLAAHTAAAACALVAAAAAAAAAGYAALGQPREAILPVAHLLAAATLSAALALDERRLPTALLAAGAGALAGRAAQDAAHADVARLLARPPFAPAALALAGVALLALRRCALSRALRGGGADAGRYAAAWAAAAAGPAHAAALSRIDALVDALAAAAPPAAARHLLRPRPAAPAAAPDTAGAPWARVGSLLSHAPRDPDPPPALSIPGRPGPATLPVGSLDQLYTQARAAAALLSRACAGWAAASGGSIWDPPARGGCDAGAAGPPLAGEGGAEDEDSGAGGGPGRPAVRIKGPGRAVEKALGRYGGDVSRVLDLCRARLSFAAPDGLARALAALAGGGAGGAAGGGGVRVVRARNTMRPGDDPAVNSGLRVTAPHARWTMAWLDYGTVGPGHGWTMAWLP